MMLMMMRLCIYLYARLYPGATVDARDVCIAALKILILHFWPQVDYTHCTIAHCTCRPRELAVYTRSE